MAKQLITALNVVLLFNVKKVVICSLQLNSEKYLGSHAIIY